MKTIIETALTVLTIIHPTRTSFNSKEVTGVIHAPLKHPSIQKLWDESTADSIMFYPQYITQLLTQTQKRKTPKVQRLTINNRYYYSLIE